MGDKDYGLTQLSLESKEFTLEFVACKRVERGKRLVHQKNGRVGRQCPSHSNSLPLSARKLSRISGRHMWFESYDPQQIPHACANPLYRPAVNRWDERNVPLDGEMRE
jgi:hypothetical protein